MDRREARSIALSFPDAVEQDHHGRPSFRVRGKIYATLWDEEHMNVMLDEEGILAAVEGNPEVCEVVHWGKRVAAVRVELPAAPAELLEDFLQQAWRLKAPRKLIEETLGD